MTGIKNLVKDSLYYGGSAFLGKMISWLLTTLFTYTLAESDFGLMTNLYAYAALFQVILTCGMETGFFRFANQSKNTCPEQAYSTASHTVAAIAITFLLTLWIFLPQIKPWLWRDEIPNHYIRLLILILSLDALAALPFARLRYQKNAKKFALLKLINVLLYTSLCLLFLLLLPQIADQNPQLSPLWKPNSKLGYVFLANLLASAITLLTLQRRNKPRLPKPNPALARQMLQYSLPLMLMGIAGVANQVIDKIIYPVRYPDPNRWETELGVYSACFKLALILMMYTQAFRYAYEPYLFEKSKEPDARNTYAQIMTHFIQIALLVTLAILFYLPLVKYLIHPAYFTALDIVPVALLGELLFAVYYNLSIWYKLSGNTAWGTLFSFLGLIIILSVSYYFIPEYSYRACAWAIVAGNAVMALLAWSLGKKRYPIPYQWKTIGAYTLFALLLYLLAQHIPLPAGPPTLLFRTLLLAIYAASLKRIRK